ncbi:MAG: hypothetical protein K2H04_05275 [Bacteroidaceae bacterium]|nr:hypothetical protein [Bacteroidaceae bacterium]
MRRLIFLMLCITTAMSIQAQKDRGINDIFEGNGIDKSRITETIIRGEQLEPYHLTVFHSIKFNATEKERNDIEKQFYTYISQNASRNDGGKPNSEMESRGGHLYYAIAEVKPLSPFDRRYICYQCSSTPMAGTFSLTLVSLEGKVSLQNLRKMFKKK